MNIEKSNIIEKIIRRYSNFEIHLTSRMVGLALKSAELVFDRLWLVTLYIVNKIRHFSRRTASYIGVWRACHSEATARTRWGGRDVMKGGSKEWQQRPFTASPRLTMFVIRRDVRIRGMYALYHYALLPITYLVTPCVSCIMPPGRRWKNSGISVDRRWWDSRVPLPCGVYPR